MAVDTASKPIPSSDPEVANRNLEDLDKFVNTTGTILNRAGNQIRTIQNIVDKANADAAALQSAYIITAINGGVWAVGQTFTAYNQYMVFSGVSYRPKTTTTLPYVTEATPNATFVEPFTDLTQTGADIRYTASIGTVADLRNFTPSVSNQQIVLLGHTNKGVGGGVFYYDAGDLITADDNGVVIVTGAGERWKRKICGFVTPSMFGAIPDGLTDSQTACADAIAFAGTDGLDVVYEAGGYVQTANINIPADVNIKASGEAEIITNTFPVFTTAGSNVIDGLTFSNGAGTLTCIEVSGDNVTVSNNTFNGGGQQVLVKTADFLTVSGNHFEDTGYQIIQSNGFTSNNGLVVNNTSLNCLNDFVELNSGASNISKNWTVSGNRVKNVGGASPASVATEARFFGSTATANIIITDNVIENCAGDSMIHIEGETEQVTISNNVFINPHGAFGSLVFIVGSADNPATVNFTNNIARLESTYANLTGDGTRLIYALAGDAVRWMISNNTFINESPETKTVFAGSLTQSILFESNRVVGFDTGVNVITAVGKECLVKNNIFEDIGTTCVLANPNASNQGYDVKIIDNHFTNATEVWTGNSDTQISELHGNILNTSSDNIDEAFVIGERGWSDGVYSNLLNSSATTTLQNDISIPLNTETRLINVEFFESILILVKTGNPTISASDATSKVVLATRNSPFDFDITELHSTSSGSGAPFTLATSGTYMTYEATATNVVRMQVLNNMNAQTMVNTAV